VSGPRVRPDSSRGFCTLECQQIVTGTYPRVLHELALQVVASLEGLNKGGGLQSAIVEWGGAPEDKTRMGLLIGPLPEDYKKFSFIKNGDVPQFWVHVHMKFN
jgi:hypothetical protein